MSETEHPAAAVTEAKVEPPAPAPTDEERAAAAEKYKPAPAKTARDEVRAFFAPLRAMIVHAANGDRTAMAAALTHLADLHQGGPLEDDRASDHLRTAGAAVEMGHIVEAQAALDAAKR